jgi:hypothetical protein
VVRGRPGGRGWLIGTIVAIHLAVLATLAWRSGYVSQRHALPPFAPLLGYVALGLPVVGGAVVRWFPRLSHPRIPVATLLALAWICAFQLPLDFSVRRSERLAERRAAEWLRQRDGRGESVVATTRMRSAYYAGMRFLALPPGRDAIAMRRYLARNGADYVIVDERVAGDYPGLPEAGLELLHRERVGERSALVFEVQSGGTL